MSATLRLTAVVALIASAPLLGSPARAASGRVPDCTGSERYPAMVALVKARNAGLVKQGEAPRQARVVRIASEKIGSNLYRQVHDITFTLGGGRRLELITVGDVSSEECSVSSVRVLQATELLR